ncbi:MAG: RNA polymerase sigma factor [Myxococcota bacterium]|nr:RNA polymerase sigma factor [Myxococcota bacterium]
MRVVPESDPRAVDDEFIVEVARTDRDRAFDLLVRKYRDRIYYHALYICKDSEEAFDVAQDVFVRAYHESRLFQEDFRAKAWLFRVCTNRCYNIVRDKNRRRGILERIGKQSPQLSESHQAITTVLEKEMSDGITRAMDELSPDHKNILLLRYFHDLSYQEIADALEVKLGTVMSRLSRAKRGLKQVLPEDAVK